MCAALLLVWTLQFSMRTTDEYKLTPVPVREIAPVTALISQILLKSPDDVSMPEKEVPREVVELIKLNVPGRIVIISILNARVRGVAIEMRLLAVQAGYGIGVLLSHVLGHLAAAEYGVSNQCWILKRKTTYNSVRTAVLNTLQPLLERCLRL